MVADNLVELIDIKNLDYDKVLECLYRWHSDYRLSKSIGFNNPQDIIHTKNLLDKWILDNTKRIFFVVDNGKFLGYVALLNINDDYKSADLHSLMQDGDFSAKRIYKESIDKILDKSFNEFDLYRITTYVMGDNEILIRNAQKYGFILEGIMKDFILMDNKRVDYWIFRMLKDEFNKRRLKCQ